MRTEICRSCFRFISNCTGCRTFSRVSKSLITLIKPPVRRNENRLFLIQVFSFFVAFKYHAWQRLLIGKPGKFTKDLKIESRAIAPPTEMKNFPLFVWKSSFTSWLVRRRNNKKRKQGNTNLTLLPGCSVFPGFSLFVFHRRKICV